MQYLTKFLPSLTAYKRKLQNYMQQWILISISICICLLCQPPPPSISLSLFLLGLLLALTHCNETQLLLKRKERVAVTALIKRLVLASRAEEALVSQRSCPIHHASHTPVQFYTQTHTGTHTAVQTLQHIMSRQYRTLGQL